MDDSEKDYMELVDRMLAVHDRHRERWRIRNSDGWKLTFGIWGALFALTLAMVRGTGILPGDWLPIAIISALTIVVVSHLYFVCISTRLNQIDHRIAKPILDEINIFIWHHLNEGNKVAFEKALEDGKKAFNKANGIQGPEVKEPLCFKIIPSIPRARMVRVLRFLKHQFLTKLDSFPWASRVQIVVTILLALIIIALACRGNVTGKDPTSSGQVLKIEYSATQPSKQISGTISN